MKLFYSLLFLGFTGIAGTTTPTVSSTQTLFNGSELNPAQFNSSRFAQVHLEKLTLSVAEAQGAQRSASTTQSKKPELSTINGQLVIKLHNSVTHSR